MNGNFERSPSGGGQRSAPISETLSSSAPGWKVMRACPTTASARTSWNKGSNMLRVSKSCFADRKLNRFSKSSGSTARIVCRSRAKPSDLTGRYPACPRRPTSRWSESMRAGCELFTLLPDGDGLRARKIIVHLSDFTRRRVDSSPTGVDQALFEQCVARPEDVSHSIWNGKGILIVKVRGAASIVRFLTTPSAAPRNSKLQPHPHEPWSQRISGEPLLQRRRQYSGRSERPHERAIVSRRLTNVCEDFRRGGIRHWTVRN